MWGSTKPNTADECRWKNAPFNNGSDSYNSTYFNSVKDTVCPNGILAKEYDAAAQIMGGNWRMPTKGDCRELARDTTNEWIEDFKGTGVNGMKFTSKTDTTKYIFIPAAGNCVEGSMFDVGDEGHVWSSSLDPEWVQPTSFYMYFTSDDWDYNDSAICVGQSVRGVFK